MSKGKKKNKAQRRALPFRATPKPTPKAGVDAAIHNAVHNPGKVRTLEDAYPEEREMVNVFRDKSLPNIDRKIAKVGQIIIRLVEERNRAQTSADSWERKFNEADTSSFDGDPVAAVVEQLRANPHFFPESVPESSFRELAITICAALKL